MCAINSCNWLLCGWQKFLMCCVQSLELSIVYLSHEKAAMCMTFYHLKVVYSEIKALPF
jgi:hypothetical protein